MKVKEIQIDTATEENTVHEESPASVDGVVCPNCGHVIR